MSGSGKVTDVGLIGYEPRENKPAIRVLVDTGEKEVVFWIAPGVAPVVGKQIAWGPHYAWWAPNVRVHKGPEWDPNDPHLYSG